MADDERPSTRQNIQLLTAIRSVDGDGATSTKCFGNILELGCDAMVVESNRQQQPGSALALTVIFPGQHSATNKEVTFHCVVRTVRDQNRMHYDLAIDHMNDIARERLFRYLSATGTKERSQPTG